MSDLPPRTPWPDDFPDVVTHTSVAERDQHPHYQAAKAGDGQAAVALARDLVTGHAVTALRQIIGARNPSLTPVTALETKGFNALPDALAQVIGEKLGLPLDDGELVQRNLVAHTRASGWHRIVTPPTFGGAVKAGRDYLLIDDHIGLGGTLANLRGYIETNGGTVIAMTTLTQSRDAAKIALTPATLAVLRSKHGQDLETYWRTTFGYGLDCCTEVEGSYIARRPTFDAIARVMAEAAEKARGGGLSTIAV
jgi:adenine/guanine phosphoribosyltransferase-like PRPP-binding protein